VAVLFLLSMLIFCAAVRVPDAAADHHALPVDGGVLARRRRRRATWRA